MSDVKTSHMHMAASNDDDNYSFEYLYYLFSHRIHSEETFLVKGMSHYIEMYFANVHTRVLP